jgi:hypothetical protein
MEYLLMTKQLDAVNKRNSLLHQEVLKAYV